jgi:hypothetical protein
MRPNGRSRSALCARKMVRKLRQLAFPNRSGCLPDTEQLCGILYETPHRWLTNEHVCHLTHNYAAAQCPRFADAGRLSGRAADSARVVPVCLGWAGERGS